MERLQDWLKGIGLEQYWKVFSDNDIDFEALPDFSESDFEKLGLSLGHRRKLSKALATLRSAPTVADSRVSRDRTGNEAERRQVTVLFSDLVGSTALANELDPEELSGLIKQYQNACAQAIARFDGYIAKFMGDGVLAYFGYPQGQEDAAERSVYAGLALIEAVSHGKLPDGRSLHTRVGIATGLVVVGDIIGTGASREHNIVGETPNLAARLQALAEPDSVIVSQSTHRLLGGQFDCESLGEQSLKGFAAPVKVWRILREASVASRFAAGHAATASRFVGRVQELGLMFERWQLAKAGEGQAIFLSAEAGMGKSRMVEALRERIADDAYHHAVCQCSPYHVNSPFHPVIRQLGQAAGFAGEDTTSTRLEKLEDLLAAAGNLNDSTRSLFADLLSLPLPDEAFELGAAQRKAATIAALVHQLARLATQRPMLFVLEDAHWIDPTTQEFMAHLLDRIAALPFLAIITARPEFSSPWTGRSHLTTLALSRLSRAQCAELVAGVATERRLDPGLVADIIEKGDGVPLFVEELTKTVVESAPADRPAVPATLHDSLIARLDRLGTAKEAAQVAAVIGQRFSRALLENVSNTPPAELDVALARLGEAGIAFRQMEAAEPSYVFKHALMRDVAYNNLLRTRRQQLHGRVARALEEHFAATAESEPELVAYHFARAGLAELAGHHYERAGDRAVARSNFAEAVAHFDSSLQEISKLAENPDRSRRELSLLLKISPAQTVIKGAQSDEAVLTCERARTLGATLNDHAAHFQATWGLWYAANIGRKLERARDLTEELVRLAQQSSDSDLMLEACHCRWSTAMFRGEVRAIVEYCKDGIKRYDPTRHSWMATVFGGHDPGVCAYSCCACGLCQSGLFSAAWKRCDEALALAESLDHPHSLGHAFLNVLIASQLSGDAQRLEGFADRAILLAEKYNFPPQRAHALMILNWWHATTQNSAAALGRMEAEYPRAIAVGPMFRYYAMLLAEAQVKFEHYPEALGTLETALATITEPGVGYFVPELHRLHGLCLLGLGSGRKDEAFRSLRMAVNFAKKQSATLFHLKSAIALVRAEAATGDAAANRQLLREVRANLPKEFDAPQLWEAEQLLAAQV